MKSFDDQAIIDALDIREEYRAMGVDVNGEAPGADGWIACHAIGREDKNASAGINARTGRYKDHGGDGECLSLWDFAAKHGGHSDWRAARAHYAKKAGVTMPGSSGNGGPAADLKFLPWSDNLAMLWARYKPGVTADAARAVGAKLARYRDRHTVIALPIHGEKGKGADPVGWVLYDISGKSLPVYEKGNPKPVSRVKIKTTAGSKSGFIGDVDSIPTAALAISVEGPSDLLALWAKIPMEEHGHVAVVCNSGGASENPKPWQIEMLAKARRLALVRDADEPGQRGLNKWSAALAKQHPDVRAIQLPYPIDKNHGRDLRDFLNEGHTFQDFTTMIDQAEPVKADAVAGPLSNARIEYGENDESATVPISMLEIIAAIDEQTEGELRRVGKSLFVHSPGKSLDWLESTAALFGWLQSRVGLVEWRKSAPGMVGKEELFAEVRRVSPCFDGVDNLPHVPPIPTHYYTCTPLEPGDAGHLDKLLSFFSLESDVDRELLRAAVATPLWGGPPGSRPAFMFTATEGRGRGKSKLTQFIAQLYGGLLDIDPREDIGQIKTRMLSPQASAIRVLRLDNLKSVRFSWGALESLITSDVVSGKALYVGEGCRSNHFTWLITLNGASLSTDMAQRVVEVKLQNPEYSGDWETTVAAFIESHRNEILAGLASFLTSPKTALKTPTRWATWENEIVARLDHPDQALQTIVERRGQVDAEVEEGAIVQDYFASKLNGLNYAVDRADVFIPSRIAAGWYSKAVGEGSLKTTSASRALNQLHKEGRLPWIIEARGLSGEHGFRWIGEHCDVDTPIERDLEKKLAKKLEKQETGSPNNLDSPNSGEF